MFVFKFLTNYDSLTLGTIQRFKNTVLEFVNRLYSGLALSTLFYIRGHGRTSRASLLAQAFSVLRTSKTCLQQGLTRYAGWFRRGFVDYTGLASQDLPTIRFNPYGVP
jgi:hypothetical protein